MQADQTLRDELKKGPFTLALSSGFFGFFAHHGLSMALLEAGLIPARVTGASAGSIVAAGWSYGMIGGELRQVLNELKREHFWDPFPGIGYLRGARLESFLRGLFSGRERQLPLSVSTYDIFARKTVSFSDGDIPKIVRASCAIPLMFHPVRIGRRYYWDGGVRDKSALDTIQPGEKVLVHYLPSWGPERVLDNKRVLEILSRRHHVISPTNLPSVGPHQLENGLRAMEIAYESAKNALNSTLK